MDKFRITFKCIKIPRDLSSLEGYAADKQYTGRTYNGLFEVSTHWGSDRPTALISKQLFDQYFILLEKAELNAGTLLDSKS